MLSSSAQVPAYCFEMVVVDRNDTDAVLYGRLITV